MDRFDTFSDSARAALTFAQDEAQRLGHNYIGTEHLLLGLLRDANSEATLVLLALQIDPDKVRIAIEFIVGHGQGLPPAEVGLTERVKRSIELAIAQARMLGDHAIGTQHLLLGLISEGEGIAAGVLASLGGNLDRARREVVRLAELGSSEGSDTGSGRGPGRSFAVSATRTPSGSDFSDPGDIVRVVPVALSQQSPAQHVELLALEVRLRGVILSWSVRSLDEREPARALPLSLTDERSGTYVAQTLDTAWIGARLLGRTLVVPRPSAEVTTLLVEVLENPGTTGESADVRWRRFEVRLDA